MEEKEKTKASEQPKQLSYDELKNIAGQLQQQNMQLRRALNELDYKNMFERLNYLFKVMEFSHMFHDEFVGKCVTEVETLMTVPDDSSDTSENNSESKE